MNIKYRLLVYVKMREQRKKVAGLPAHCTNRLAEVIMNCEYVRNAYGVPACVGRKVVYKGRAGIISADRGNYIGVTFDDEKPGTISNFHPETEGLEYLGMGKVRKMTKSQERYRRYLEYGDGFRNFRDFLFWDSCPERSWNRGRD